MSKQKRRPSAGGKRTFDTKPATPIKKPAPPTGIAGLIDRVLRLVRLRK